MKDRRRPPFAYQELAATALIRWQYGGQMRLTALAVYQTLTEVANEQRTREEFEATRGEIAERAGCSRDTLDRYVKGFVKLGIIEVERRVGEGGVNLPNVWTLISPEGGRTDAATPSTAAPGSRTGAATPSRTDAATPGRTSAGTPGRTGAADPRAGETEQEEQQRQEVPPGPPQAGGTQPARPSGGRKRDQDRYRSEMRVWADANVPHPSPEQAAQMQEWWAPRAARLREIVGETSYELWLSSLHPHAVHGGVLYLGVPEEHIAWVTTRAPRALRVVLDGRTWEAIPCNASLTKESDVHHSHPDEAE